jgi:hypothetical protein
MLDHTKPIGQMIQQSGSIQSGNKLSGTETEF